MEINGINYVTRTGGEPHVAGGFEIIKVSRNGDSVHVSYHTPCYRCDGKGKVRGFEHVANGVCFKCEGHTTYRIHDRLYTPARIVELDAAQEAKARKARDEAEALFNESLQILEGEVPGLTAAVAFIDVAYDDIPEHGPWLRVWRPLQTALSVVGNGRSFNGFTRKQAKAVVELAQRICDSTAQIAAEVDGEEAAVASGIEVGPGRYEIRAAVVGFKEVPGFGYHAAPVTKVVLKDRDGRKFYGTLPSSISDAQRGDEVSVVATVTPSGDDPLFGFFKRPTKGQITNRAA